MIFCTPHLERRRESPTFSQISSCFRKRLLFSSLPNPPPRKFLASFPGEVFAWVPSSESNSLIGTAFPPNVGKEGTNNFPPLLWYFWFPSSFPLPPQTQVLHLYDCSRRQKRERRGEGGGETAAQEEISCLSRLSKHW